VRSSGARCANTPRNSGQSRPPGPNNLRYMCKLRANFARNTDIIHANTVQLWYSYTANPVRIVLKLRTCNVQILDTINEVCQLFGRTAPESRISAFFRCQTSPVIRTFLEMKNISSYKFGRITSAPRPNTVRYSGEYRHRNTPEVRPLFGRSSTVQQLGGGRM